MAEIPVRRKRNLTWLWVLLPLLLIAGLIWWAVADDEGGVTEPVGTEARHGAVPGQQAVTQTEAGAVAGQGAVGTEVRPGAAAGQEADGSTARDLTIPNILASPGAFVGRDDFSGEVNVREVPTDRGFWVEDQGQRLFALIIDEPSEVPKDINPGQRLRISRGMIRDKTFLSDMPGRPLKGNTQRIIQDQDVYLVVDEDNIEFVSQR